MNRRIWKYELAITDEQKIEVPPGFKPLHVGAQPTRLGGLQLCLWAEVNEGTGSTDNMPLLVRVIGTGNAMPDMSDFGYVGTVQMGLFVWHVYVERMPW